MCAIFKKKHNSNDFKDIYFSFATKIENIVYVDKGEILGDSDDKYTCVTLQKDS